MGSRRRQHSRPVGRPKKIMEPEVRDTLITALKAGAPVALACEAASIAQSTFHGWMQKGYDAHMTHAEGGEVDEAGHLYRELYEDTQRARAAAALRNVGIIQKVAAGGTVLERTTERDPDGTERVIEKRQAPDWRAAAWHLERSYKGPFVKDATEVHLSGAGGGPVAVSVDAASLAERLSLHLAEGAVTAPLMLESTREEAEKEDDQAGVSGDTLSG